MNRKWIGLVVLAVMLTTSGRGAEKVSVIAPGAKTEKLAGDFKFTEGAASDAEGNVFFSDIPNNRISGRWMASYQLFAKIREGLTVFTWTKRAMSSPVKEMVGGWCQST
jgi:sugar lactone lactonase YvrE